VTSKNDALSVLNDKNSIYQDPSIETLQSRGVQFLNLSHRDQRAGRVVITRNSWSKDAEEIVHEMLGRTLRDVLVVAAKIRYEGTLK